MPEMLLLLLLSLPLLLLLRDGFGSESVLAGTERGTTRDLVVAARAH